MIVAIDVDDTITYAPDLFAPLSKMHRDQGHRVIIVTIREASDGTVEELAEIGVVYDEIVTSDHPTLGCREDENLYAWKARILEHELRVNLVYEDSPEIISRLGSHILALMPVDEVIRAWMREQLGL